MINNDFAIRVTHIYSLQFQIYSSSELLYSSAATEYLQTQSPTRVVVSDGYIIALFKSCLGVFEFDRDSIKPKSEYVVELSHQNTDWLEPLQHYCFLHGKTPQILNLKTKQVTNASFKSVPLKLTNIYNEPYAVFQSKTGLEFHPLNPKGESIQVHFEGDQGIRKTTWKQWALFYEETEADFKLTAVNVFDPNDQFSTTFDWNIRENKRRWGVSDGIIYIIWQTTTIFFRVDESLRLFRMYQYALLRDVKDPVFCHRNLKLVAVSNRGVFCLLTGRELYHVSSTITFFSAENGTMCLLPLEHDTQVFVRFTT